jgi:nicotinate-nucleotide--dimethylbenzimidazole phosphoribosyltransferase
MAAVKRKPDDMLAKWVYQECPVVSIAHRDAALGRQAQLTKPAGSLGRIEQLAVELAGLQQTDRPRAENAPIIIFAGDHGVVAQGVSAYPKEVTIAMMSNFAAGGAAISVLARQLGCSLEVVDAGTLASSPLPGVVSDKLRQGSRDFSREAALEPAEVAFAFECGKRAVQRAIERAPDLLILGEMGIGNTTSAAAIAASLLGIGAGDITGSGTGIDASRLAHKVRVIDDALVFHGLARTGVSVEDVLCAVGGLEISAICGAMITAAQNRLPVLIDGFIVSVAALAAVRLNPSCRPFLIASHQSAEQGHRRVVHALNLKPLISLDLRLGEASGAAIALPLLRLACALHNDMATFTQANVPTAQDETNP